MAANATRVLYVNLPYDRVFAVIIPTMMSVGVQSYACNPATKVFTGSTGMGLTSWGEDITVWVAVTPQGSAVNIKSECSLPTQLIDWGKNKENINKFATELSRLLQAPVY
jgi:hypothetical protein